MLDEATWGDQQGTQSSSGGVAVAFSGLERIGRADESEQEDNGAGGAERPAAGTGG
jgi:hypothetical protein